MTCILFVCTANQFRSPIAAAYFVRKLIASGISVNWMVSSAGTWTSAGLPAHPSAIHSASKFGLDLSAHRTREVTAAILSAADLIVVMSSGHKEALLAEFPASANRIVLLTESAPGFGGDIEDPALTNFASADAVTTQIIDCLDRGFDALVSLAESQLNYRPTP